MKRLFINAGHAPDGVPDPGAVNQYWGVRECDIALEVSKMLGNKLEGSGYEVMVYQDDSLEYIARTTNDWDADYFISIHCNSAYTDQAKGSEVYCYSMIGEGARLAQCIQNRLVGRLAMVNRGVKEANFYVLRHTEMPAVLVEMGFINNSEDCDKLVNRTEDFAEAIYQGIIRYLE